MAGLSQLLHRRRAMAPPMLDGGSRAFCAASLVDLFRNVNNPPENSKLTLHSLVLLGDGAKLNIEANKASLTDTTAKFTFKIRGKRRCFK